MHTSGLSWRKYRSIHGGSTTCTQVDCLCQKFWRLILLSYQDLQDKQVYHSRYGLRIAGGFVSVGGSNSWM